MYLNFYGLADRPFNTTPNPKFLYMSPGHREPLAQLLYGTQERKGFIVLTGKVGTGKTTLLHTLRQRLNGQSPFPLVGNSTLRIAGAKDLGLFSDEAVVRLSAYSGGIPRVINTVCDHCLLFGYADQKRRISRQIVNQAIEYLEAGTRPQPRELNRPTARFVRWSLGTLVATLAVVALVLRLDSTAMTFVQS